MRILLLIATVILGLGQSAFADANTGNDLLRSCNAAVKQDDGGDLDAKESLAAVYCLGYLSGFTDSHAMEGLGKPAKPLYCLPENGLENAQLARLFTKYLKKNLEVLHGSGRVLLAAALTNSFPCKQKATSK